MNRDWLLTILILVGLIAGVVVGEMIYDADFDLNDTTGVHAHAGTLDIFEFVGVSVFMGLLKMLIIPLVASSVIVGVTSVGDFSRLGRIGAATLFYYFATMLIAVIIGLVIVTTIRPGDELAESPNISLIVTEQQTEHLREITERGEVMAEAGLMAAVRNLVGQMIPINIVAAMAKGQPLGVICFSIFFGVIVTTLGDKGRIIVEFFSAVFEVLMRMVVAVMWLAPIGVFALLAWTIGRIGLAVFVGPAGKFIVGSLLGIGIHALIVLPLILWIFGRTNPFRFMFQLRQALLTALATDSSSATLPVTIECVTEYGGVGKETAGFVLPLGSTINMDGTALYEAVAAVFLAQAFGGGSVDDAVGHRRCDGDIGGCGGGGDSQRGVGHAGDRDRFGQWQPGDDGDSGRGDRVDSRIRPHHRYVPHGGECVGRRGGGEDHRPVGEAISRACEIHIFDLPLRILQES